MEQFKGDLIKELAIEVLEEVERKKRIERRRKKYHNTELLMKNYNSLKNHIDKVEYDFNGEEEEFFIESITKTKLRTIQMLGYVDKALKIVKQDLGKKREKYKFFAFEKYYFERKNIDDICKELSCSKNSVRRWNSLIIEELSLLLWGVDFLEF